MITAQPEHKLCALQAGAKDFVSKPFDLAEVTLTVTIAIGDDAGTRVVTLQPASKNDVRINKRRFSMTNIRKYWPVVPLVLIVAFWMAIRESAPTPVHAAPGSTTPVSVRDVDNSAHHPFAQELNCNVPGGSKSCGASFTVAAGKELVIETASVLGTIPTGGKGFATITITTGGTNLSSLQLPLTYQATYGGTVDTYVGTQTLRLYADPSSIVTLVGGEQPVGAANFIFDVSGYTVDCGSSGTITNPCPLP